MSERLWNDDGTMTNKGFKKFYDLPEDFDKHVDDKIVGRKIVKAKDREGKEYTMELMHKTCRFYITDDGIDFDHVFEI